MGKLFGTDGIRGVANVDLRPTLAFALGRATAHLLAVDRGDDVAGPAGARSAVRKGLKLELEGDKYPIGFALECCNSPLKLFYPAASGGKKVKAQLPCPTVHGRGPSIRAMSRLS